jgi:hypothetical protein
MENGLSFPLLLDPSHLKCPRSLLPNMFILIVQKFSQRLDCAIVAFQTKCPGCL